VVIFNDLVNVVQAFCESRVLAGALIWFLELCIFHYVATSTDLVRVVQAFCEGSIGTVKANVVWDFVWRKG
jgi:hypothetical protein